MSLFLPILTQVCPRILTQVCRDRNATAYGSFDRNWWHYKIRDFSSVILQQGGYFLYELGNAGIFPDRTEDFHRLARASVAFWTRRALSRGAFEEYYPWEKGYPPLAFSTLAAAKLIGALDIRVPETDKALQKACRQLLSRFEHQAGNQQLSGLAALAVIRTIRPGFVDAGRFALLAERSLKLQDAEGWFVEYDGPDLGYLSVTMDCLWDLYDHTGDRNYYETCLKSFRFLYILVTFLRRSPGMHNARNTDYLAPYGLARFLFDDEPGIRKKADSLFRILYGDIGSPDHFFHAVDDRYWCHYIGHSVARAEQLLQAGGFAFEHGTGETEETADAFFGHSGYLLRTRKESRVLVSGLKGGLISVFTDRGCFSDFGWVVKDGRNQFVNHWWSHRWTITAGEDRVSVSGRLVPHREKVSTPSRHILLRVASCLFGYRIIGWLKGQLIFRTKSSRYDFTRTICFATETIGILDLIRGLKGGEEILEAPRASKRHVASADSFHPEDFRPVDHIQVEQVTRREGELFMSEKTLKNC